MLLFGLHFSVSIPHRYGKNRNKVQNSWCVRGVSIPHRYGKNFCGSVGVPCSHFVSIPHRYGKNLLAVSGVDVVNDVFPFLIGTVRTITGL